MLGNKNIELSKEELLGLTKCYDKTIIDLGTGDGRFVYKSAVDNPDFFYIGIDPSEKQLKNYSIKSVRKKLPNVFFCLGSIELLPKELINTANKVFILLPWGTLLKNVVLPSRENAKKLCSLLKTGGELEIIFGYYQEFEPSEIERLELPPLSKDYIENVIIPNLCANGFEYVSLQQIKKTDLKKIETTWSKKLSFGKIREIFKLTLTKKIA